MEIKSLSDTLHEKDRTLSIILSDKGRQKLYEDERTRCETTCRIYELLGMWMCGRQAMPKGSISFIQKELDRLNG